jgi:hypothetical protein
MRDTFSETAEAVLSFRANRDPAVRRMVITMIPTLASYNTAAFTDQVLHKAMAHLLSQLSSSSSSNSSSSTFSSTSSFSSSFSSGGGGGVGTAERDYALIAIGHTATAVGAEMKPFLESVMSHIKARLKDVAAAAQAQAYAEKGAHGAGAAGAGATRRWVSFFFFVSIRFLLFRLLKILNASYSLTLARIQSPACATGPGFGCAWPPCCRRGPDADDAVA